MQIELGYRSGKPSIIIVKGVWNELKQIRGGYNSQIFGRSGYSPPSSVEMPLTPMSLDLVKDQFPKTKVSSDVAHWFSNERQRREGLAWLLEKGKLPSSYDLLYSFQRQGVSFLLGARRVLLGDDPRLGKTVQSLTAMQILHRNNNFQYPVVVFAPKPLLEYWEDAVAQWTEFTPIIVHGSTKTRLENIRDAEPNNVVITNWETLRYIKNPSKFRKLFSRVIADECHVIRNRKSGIGKAFVRLRPEVAFLMSATMIERGPQDYFSMLRVVRPSEHTSYWRWIGWFCETQFNGFGHTIIGTQNEDLLADYMAPFSLRRKASEVADVPPKQWDTVE